MFKSIFKYYILLTIYLFSIFSGGNIGAQIFTGATKPEKIRAINEAVYSLPDEEVCVGSLSGNSDLLNTSKWCQSAKDFLIPFMKNQLAAENSLTLTVNSSGVLEVNIDDNSVKIAKNCNNPGNFADSDLIVNYINKVFGPGSAETDHEGCSALSGVGSNTQGHIWFKDKNIGLFAYVKFLTFRMFITPNPSEPELGEGSPFEGLKDLNSMLNEYCSGGGCPDGNDLSSGTKYASYGSTTPATINGEPTDGSTSMDSIRQALSCLAGIPRDTNSLGWNTSYTFPDNGVVDFWFNEYLTQEDKNNGNITQYRQFNVYDKLRENIDIYKKIGQEKDFPWEIIASIHYHEEGMYLYNPINDQGIYQFYNDATADHGNNGAYPLGDVSVAEFETQTRKFIDEFRSKSDKTFKYGLQNNDPSEIKDAMFSYNGRAGAYKTMAQNLGFDKESQGYEGSWYVMNLADSKPYSFSWNSNSHSIETTRLAMILCSRDGCVGVDGVKDNQDDWIVESRAPGAFTFLSALINDPRASEVSGEKYNLNNNTNTTPGSTPSCSSGQSISQPDSGNDTSSTPCYSGTDDLGITEAYTNGVAGKIRLCAIPGFVSSGEEDIGGLGLVRVGSVASQKILELYSAMKSAGIEPSAVSSFRSNDFQTRLYENSGGSGMVAKPGYSIHQSGMAIDFNLPNCNPGGKDSVGENYKGCVTEGSTSATCKNSTNPDNIVDDKPMSAPDDPVWAFLIDNKDSFGLNQLCFEAWHWEYRQ